MTWEIQTNSRLQVTRYECTLRSGLCADKEIPISPEIRDYDIMVEYSLFWRQSCLTKRSASRIP